MKGNFLYQITAAPEPLTRGLPSPDLRYLCPLSSTEFVEPPEKNSWVRHWLHLTQQALPPTIRTYLCQSSSIRAMSNSNLLCNQYRRGHECLNIHLFCTRKEIRYISSAQTTWPRKSATESMDARSSCWFTRSRKSAPIIRPGCFGYRGRQWRTQEFFSGGSTNSVEDRGQRERGSGGGNPLVRVLETAVIWYKKFHFIW